MVGDYPADPQNVDLSVFHSVEVPKGSGMNYSDGITPFVLAKIRQRSGIESYIMETGFRHDNVGKAVGGYSSMEDLEVGSIFIGADAINAYAKHLHDLIAGKAIQQPVYDFKQHTREQECVPCKPTQLIVVEGLYTLHFPKIVSQCDYKIFVSTGMVTAVLRRHQRPQRRLGVARLVADLRPRQREPEHAGLRRDARSVGLGEGRRARVGQWISARDVSGHDPARR